MFLNQILEDSFISLSMKEYNKSFFEDRKSLISSIEFLSSIVV